jgi:hypothetical protein
MDYGFLCATHVCVPDIILEVPGTNVAELWLERDEVKKVSTGQSRHQRVAD